MRILIVDDERNTREGIRDIVNWSRVHIDELDFACDGVEAMEAIRARAPDILLCDVRMPRLDGISLAGAVREEYPHIQIVFLSGYSDRAYLKAAIQFQAVDYVEKPVDVAVLEASLIKAVNRVRDEKSRLTDALSSLISKILSDYGGGTPPGGELAALLELNDARRCRAVFLQFPMQDAEPAETLQQTVEEACREAAYVEFSARLGLTDWLLLLSSPDEDALGRAAMARVFNRLADGPEGGRRVAMSLSRIVKADNLPAAMRQARAGKSLIFVCGYGSVVEPGDAAPEKGPWGEEYLSRLPELASQCRLQEIRALLEEARLRLKRAAAPEPPAVKDWLMRFLITLHNNLAGTPPTPDIHARMDSIRDCSVMDEGFAQIDDHILNAYGVLHGKLDSDDPVRIAINYVNSHFQEEISLGELARRVNFTPNYLGALFKERMGVPFRQYVNYLRVGKAKEMLNLTSLSLTEISEKLGFEDYSYFCKVFAKSEGVSPKKYRELNKL